MKLFKLPFVIVLTILLIIIPVTGCNVSQSQINSVVQNIDSYTPVIVTDATAYSKIAQTLDPADAALIQESVTILQKDSNFLTTLCNQYLAAPSSNTLSQIAATVSELATTDASALIQVAQIKNPQSVTEAEAVLAGVATTVTILSVYLQSVKVPVSKAATKSIQRMDPYVKKSVLVSELDKAKAQHLVPSYVTLSSFGY